MALYINLYITPYNSIYKGVNPFEKQDKLNFEIDYLF